MSYSLESSCHLCKKNETCADGKIIGGAISAIHSAPRGMGDNSWHQGGGTIRHECAYIDKIEDEKQEEGAQKEG